MRSCRQKFRQETESADAIVKNLRADDVARRESLGTDSLIFDRFGLVARFAQGKLCKIILRCTCVALRSTSIQKLARMRAIYFCARCLQRIIIVAKSPYFIGLFAMSARCARCTFARSRHAMSRAMNASSKARR